MINTTADKIKYKEDYLDPEKAKVIVNSDARINANSIIRLYRDEEDYALVSDLFHQLNENIIDGTKCYELLFEMAMAMIDCTRGTGRWQFKLESGGW